MASKVFELRLAGILVVFGLGGTAAAEVDASIAVVPGQALEAVIQGGPRIPLTQIALRDPRGVVVPATDLVEFRDGKETIAIAIVVEGGEVWLGNDTFEPEDSPARFVGAIEGIRRGIDGLDLAHTMPAGSLGMLITYDDRANLRVPLGPIAKITGAAFGVQKDYYSKFGQSLVQGTELAIAELEKAPTHKKLLLVIGDGNDTNNEAAKLQFADLKKRAAQDRIQIASIIYKGQLSEPTSAILGLGPLAVTANSFEGIANEMKEAVRRATSQYTVRFPGQRLSWDGKVQVVLPYFRSRKIAVVTFRSDADIAALKQKAAAR